MGVFCSSFPHCSLVLGPSLSLCEALTRTLPSGGSNVSLGLTDDPRTHWAFFWNTPDNVYLVWSVNPHDYWFQTFPTSSEQLLSAALALWDSTLLCDLPWELLLGHLYPGWWSEGPLDHQVILPVSFSSVFSESLQTFASCPQIHQEMVDHRVRTFQLPHPALLTIICTHCFPFPWGRCVPALSAVSLPSPSLGHLLTNPPALFPVSSNISFFVDSFP